MDLKNLQYEYCVVCFNCTLLEYENLFKSLFYPQPWFKHEFKQQYSVYVHLLVCVMMLKNINQYHLYTAGSFDRLIIKILGYN